jgi:very-short-patch-repair endonuclease
LNVLDEAHHVAEVDLAWPELKLCVQFDGRRIHRTRAAFVRDRKQDRALVRLGWTVVRYPWDDVVHEPDTVVEDLVRILSRADHSLKAGHKVPLLT